MQDDINGQALVSEKPACTASLRKVRRTPMKRKLATHRIDDAVRQTDDAA
jgi:hypothetical protein